MRSRLNDLFLKLRYLFKRERVEREIDRELRFHIDMRTRENQESGMPRRQARREALKKFGNVAHIKDECRDERGAGFLDVLWQDLRYGSRTLRKNPAFTFVIVATLAVGIGANSLIFSVVNAVLINPLPYNRPDRIVEVWEKSPIKHWMYNVCAPANYIDWKSQNHSFQEMAAYMGSDSRAAGVRNLALTESGGSEIVHGLYVTGDLFSVLGASPKLGRTFTADETWQGSGRVAVIGYKLWQSRFGGDPGLVGRTINLDGNSYNVVGVMPKDFYFPSNNIDLWLNTRWPRKDIAAIRRPHFLRVIARLKDGVSIDQANAEMTTIAANLAKAYPETNTEMGVGLSPIKEWVVQETRPGLLVFLAAVGLVLLIACANVANLLLSRSAARAKELAVRAALGAGRRRIVRQLLTESFLFAIIGAGIGLALAAIGIKVLAAFNPGNIPRFDEVVLDWRVVLFTVGLGLVCSILFGLAPAIAASRPDLAPTLKEGGRESGIAAHGNRARRTLVVVEIALSTMLVIGAGLMIRSFQKLQQVDLGFVPSNVLTLRLSLPPRYKTPQQGIDYFNEVLRRIKTLPGVESAGAASRLPLKGVSWTSDFTIEGRPPGEYGVEVCHEAVTPDYFNVMNTPLISGRWLTDADNSEDNPVVLVNEALGKQYFPNQNPIGQRVKYSRPEVAGIWETIVGVVGDEKQESLSAPVRPEFYDAFAVNTGAALSLAIRSNGKTGNSPKALVGAVREQIRAVDSEVPPFEVYTMDDIVYKSSAGQRFSVLLLAGFALVALALAAVGIYGMMSYSVATRKHEIGIRMALGASRGDVLSMIGRQGTTLIGIGVASGLGAALALTRLMSSLLYGVSARDPITYTLVAVFLGLVALASCYFPARRATKVDPLTALRYE